MGLFQNPTAYCSPHEHSRIFKGNDALATTHQLDTIDLEASH